MTRHRPRFLLWLPGGPVCTCDCHYGERPRFDRPMPAKPAAPVERAA